MEALFEFLKSNPFMLLFLTVGLSVWVGRFSVKGYGLGMVAAAIVVGVAIATWASTYGVKLQLDNFAKSLMYYLFMYGVGLRVGPSFFNSLKKDGLTFTILAVVCSVLGLFLVVWMSRLFGLPAGAAGGVLAGSQTMSAAIGTAEMAISQGAYKVPEGTTTEAVTAMIALGYGITYIWGTVGIILVCKYLPRWWGVDAKKAAKEYEEKFGVPNLDDTGLSGYRPAGLRAYRVENTQTAGKTIAGLRREYPQYRILNVMRGGESLGASPDITLQKADVVALGGRLEDLTANMGLLGPEVADPKALNIPLDQAEILVTER
jgi:putative transport protein